MNKDTPAPMTGCVPPPPYGWDNSQPPPPPLQQHHQHVLVMPTRFGPDTQRMTCSHCHAEISTRVESEASMKTHLFALLLCVFGLWCCVPCPYCIDSCLEKRHYCPACGAYLGNYEN